MFHFLNFPEYYQTLRNGVGEELIKILCIRCCHPPFLLSPWPPFVINPLKTEEFCSYATENHTLSLLYNFKARGLIHHSPLLQDLMESSPTFNSWPSSFCLLGAEVTGLHNPPVTICPQQREGRTWVDKETWCVLVILCGRHCPSCLKPSKTLWAFWLLWMKRGSGQINERVYIKHLHIPRPLVPPLDLS